MAKEAKETRKGGSVVLPKPVDTGDDAKDEKQQKSKDEGAKK